MEDITELEGRQKEMKLMRTLWAYTIDCFVKHFRKAIDERKGIHEMLYCALHSHINV